MPSIVITRRTRGVAFLWPVTVQVDGHDAVRLRPGSSRRFDLEPGTYVVRARMLNAHPAEMEVILEPPIETAIVAVSIPFKFLRFRDQLLLERDD